MGVEVGAKIKQHLSSYELEVVRVEEAPFGRRLILSDGTQTIPKYEDELWGWVEVSG